MTKNPIRFPPQANRDYFLEPQAEEAAIWFAVDRERLDEAVVVTRPN